MGSSFSNISKQESSKALGERIGFSRTETDVMDQLTESIKQMKIAMANDSAPTPDLTASLELLLSSPLSEGVSTHVEPEFHRYTHRLLRYGKFEDYFRLIGLYHAQFRDREVYSHVSNTAPVSYNRSRISEISKAQLTQKCSQATGRYFCETGRDKINYKFQQSTCVVVDTFQVLLCAHSIMSIFNSGFNLEQDSRGVCPFVDLAALPNMNGWIRTKLRPLGNVDIDSVELLFPCLQSPVDVRVMVTYFNDKQDVAVLTIDPNSVSRETAAILATNSVMVANSVEQYEAAWIMSYLDIIALRCQELDTSALGREVVWSEVPVNNAGGQILIEGTWLQSQSGSPIFNQYGELISHACRNFMVEGTDSKQGISVGWGLATPLLDVQAALHQAKSMCKKLNITSPFNEYPIEQTSPP